MPCYLFTFHAYGTWMPDRERGFVRRNKDGVLAPNKVLARHYRERTPEESAKFDAMMQKLLIKESRIAGEKQHYRIHCIATDPTHLHVLASWPDERPWMKIRVGLKSSLTRRLNQDVYRRHDWFVDSASRKRVLNYEHYEYLMTRYLPSHRGWKWREGGELFL